MDVLAENAMNAVKSGEIKIIPERYANKYLDWLAEKRDWCISRQLWWGHRIPIWHTDASEDELKAAFAGRDDIFFYKAENGGYLVCSQEEDLKSDAVPGHELKQEEDVLDTWFSSGLWPHSTMGWPENTDTQLSAYSMKESSKKFLRECCGTPTAISSLKRLQVLSLKSVSMTQQ
mgnify:CR=1 FL=1